MRITRQGVAFELALHIPDPQATDTRGLFCSDQREEDPMVGRHRPIRRLLRGRLLPVTFLLAAVALPGESPMDFFLVPEAAGNFSPGFTLSQALPSAVDSRAVKVCGVCPRPD